MKRILFISLLIVLQVSVIFAGGRYAGASLELGIGARPIGLAGASAAMRGNGDVFYYNPASLAFLARPTLNLMYAPSFGSLRSPLANYNYLGFAFPLPGGGTVALNWTRFTVDDIPLYPDLRGDSFSERYNDVTLRPDGVALGTFRDLEDAFYFSFAKCARKKVSLGWLFVDLPVETAFGMNVKMIRQRLYKSSASGIGIDIGTMLRFNLGTLLNQRRLGDFGFGFSMTDISQTAIIWDTKHEDRIHRTSLWGASYEQKLEFLNAKLKLFWTHHHKYTSENLFGTEFVVKNLAVRLGKKKTGLTAGMGLRFWKLSVDYAFVVSAFENLNRISCTIIL